MKFDFVIVLILNIVGLLLAFWIDYKNPGKGIHVFAVIILLLVVAVDAFIAGFYGALRGFREIYLKIKRGEYE